MVTKIDPKKGLGIALWLKKYTKLSAKRISQISGLHEFKILLLQKSEVFFEQGEIDPVQEGICSIYDLEETEKKDEPESMHDKIVKKQKRLIFSHLKSYIPGGIVWIAKRHPELSPSSIGKMFGKTPQFVKKVLSAPEPVQPVDPYANQLLTRDIFDQYSNSAK